MQLTANFKKEEFEGRSGAIPEELMKNVQELANNLQVLRDTIGKPIKVISGYRSPEYNKKIGGAKKSQHMTASASDLQVDGMTPSELKSVIEQLIKDGKMKKGGVGLYPEFTHYDIRGYNARWSGGRIQDDKTDSAEA
jgi:uncharacterized protein YcbK (DUF882 family)